MTFSEFSRRFLAHATLALGVWLVAAFALERLVPGFVSPFVNLPGVGLVFVVLACATVALSSSEISTVGRVVSLLALIVLSVCACLFFWTRIADLGGVGVALMGAGILSVLLLVAAFWSSSDRS